MSWVNNSEIRAIGMSRSGNHCIVDWALRQISGHYCFLNCAEGKTNPFRSARALGEGEICRTSIPGFSLEHERRGRFARKDCLLHSYEDAFLGHACSRWFDEAHDRIVGPSARRVDLLVLRDPFNLFASRLRAGVACPPLTTRRIWKQHARAFVRGSRHLRQQTVRVSYNMFVRSRSYRSRLARMLGLPDRDCGLRRVARCAGGSSFDGLRMDGRAEEMGVADRWRHTIDDPAYREHFDHEVLAYAREIFPAAGLPHELCDAALKGRAVA